jgi:CHAD domain-containing protein
MVRNGKWIDETLPEERVSAAAREALTARLEPVAYYLPQAALKADRDIEHVHQLRVATRRAMAALRIYRDLLPPQRTRWLEKQLKRIRESAGEARDCDVLGQRLAGSHGATLDEARAAVLSRIQECRERAQKPIVAQYKRLEDRLEHRMNKILKKVRWRHDDPLVEEPSFGDAARLALRSVCESFSEAVAGELSDVTALHHLRIAGKHLRYAMELFATAFDEDFRGELYPLIEDLQERLGQINDHASALQRIEQWQSEWNDPALAPPLVELCSAEQSALRDAHRRFSESWTRERFDALLHRFDQYTQPRVIQAEEEEVA